jgi:predicted RNA binding protein YcfA (HicA-like mRNA interferase family)
MGRKDHSTKRRDIERRLTEEGWKIIRKGPGDHVQYRHPEKPGRVTIDKGSDDIPTGTLKSVFNQAGWDW